MGESGARSRRGGGGPAGRRHGRGGRRRVSARRASAAEDPVRGARLPSVDRRPVREPIAEFESRQMGSRQVRRDGRRRVEASRGRLRARSARGAAVRELGPVSDHGFQLRILRLPGRRGVRREAVRGRRRAARVLRALHRAAALSARAARQAVDEVRRGLQRPGAGEKQIRGQARRRLRSAGRRGAGKRPGGQAPTARRETQSDGVAAGSRGVRARSRDASQESAQAQRAARRDRSARLGIPTEHRLRAARRAVAERSAQGQAAGRHERVHGLRIGDGARVSARAFCDEASRGHLGVHALQHGAPLRRVGRRR
jgi:hypothetical protein